MPESLAISFVLYPSIRLRSASEPNMNFDDSNFDCFPPQWTKMVLEKENVLPLLVTFAR